MLMVLHTNPEGASGPSGPLPPPFDQLVTEQTLTEEQARAVLAALAVGTRREAPRTEPKAPRLGIAARLAEIGAYLGAALVVAAGIVVVVQQWADMSYGTRVAVMAGTTFALVLAAVSLVLFAQGRPWADVPNGDTLRRLSGTLFSFGALGAFGTVMVAMLSNNTGASDDEVARAFTLGALAAAAVLVAARLRADTPLGEIGLVVSTVTASMALVQLTIPDEPIAIQWTLLSMGLAWALLGTFTLLMRNQMLVTSLGLLLALFASATIAGEPWSHRLALTTLIVVSLVVYLRRPLWPYLAAATAAAVVLTVSWVGEAVGAAMALLAAGLVFLVLAGAALMLHRHRTAGTAVETDPAAQPRG
ncbi:MAG: hypothetical protein LH645_09090 [Actinomycetia bacterium]|nr:hypothetical protein [Actinomycetes bacterium]